MEAAASRLRVATVVGFHIATALAVTLLNKAVLNILPLPELLLLCQSVIGLVLVFFWMTMGWYSPPKLTFGFIRGIAPILAMKIIAQLSKTYCLLYVNASFYQIARGLLLPFTVVLSYMFLSQSRPSNIALAACCITTIGFSWGLEGETVGQTSTVGVAWGVWSSLTTALETVVVKSLATKAGVMDLVFLTSLTTVPVYAMLAVFTGDIAVVGALGMNHQITFKFFKAIVISGIFNFALSVAAYLQITVTSPVTHMISTSTRGIMQSILAVVFMQHERLTRSRIISIAIILVGTLSYTVSKELEKRQKEAVHTVLPVHSEKAEHDIDERNFDEKAPFIAGN